MEHWKQMWKRVFPNVGREKDHPIIILILKAIPDEVWNCGPSARVLDLSHNSVEDVPAKIGCLSSIQVARCCITCSIKLLDVIRSRDINTLFALYFVETAPECK